MSHPVSFKEFGSDNETLYREYCSVYLYRETNLYLRSITDGSVRTGSGGVNEHGRAGDGRGGVAGFGKVGRSNPDQRCETAVAGGSNAVKLSLPWRARTSDCGNGGSSADAVEGNRVAGDVAGGGDRADSAAVVGGGGFDRACGEVDRAAVGRSTDESAVGDGGRLSDGGVEAGPPVIKRGKNYEKNKAKRERAKALRDASREKKTLVSVRAAHPQLDETWAERKVRENKVAIARLDAQLAKIKREQEDGTAEKRYKVEANLVQGQLDGAFALVPQQRVVSWAKTITSNGSSSTGSSGGKKSQASIPSVSSGLGSSSATTVSAREKQLEKEVAQLKEQLEVVEETERNKRIEMGNNFDRLVHRHQGQVIDLKQQLRHYQIRYG